MVKCIGLIIFTLFLYAPTQVIGSSHISNSYNHPKALSILNDSLTVEKSFEVNYLPLFNMVFLKLENLHNCDIEIKGKKIKTTMAARPKFLSLFRARDKRKYVIVYNNMSEFNGVLLKDIPDEALPGLYAHELMHIWDYQSRNIFGLIRRGWQYLSKRGKRKLEHYIDNMTIDAGFGESLYEWAFFVLNNSPASKEYKAFKKNIYMTPEEIHSRLHE